MRVRIHHGAHEVGGSCVEVESGGSRIVIDVGRPLTAERDDVVPLPGVPGLGVHDEPSVAAVLVSHPHLDHYGLVDQVHRDIPVLCGAGAEALVASARFFSPKGPALRASGHLRDRQPIGIGPFTITPYLVDHSGYDAYALLVDAGGRRLMYTGDLRAHGRKGGLFRRLLQQPPPGIDALLMEGTHVGHGDPAAAAVTEAELELDMARTFRETAGLVSLVASPQNVDRLVTVYRACRRSGRTLLVDLYAATVASALGRATIPQPGFPALGVFVPRRQRVAVKVSGEFHRTAAVKHLRVYPEQLAADPQRYVVLSGSSTVHELLGGGHLTGGRVVWSLWDGYLDDPSGERLTTTLRVRGVPLIHHHTSGHAPVRDLVRLVSAIRPGCVVPIHTDAAAAYAEHFPGVRPHADGEWWSV